jgi:hypothetical protein
VSKQAGGSAMRGHVKLLSAIELAEAERRVPETNALIDRQRELIEELEGDGIDFTSAKIVLDSLLVTLSLCVQDRHRLRTSLNPVRASAA